MRYWGQRIIARKARGRNAVRQTQKATEMKTKGQERIGKMDEEEEKREEDKRRRGEKKRREEEERGRGNVRRGGRSRCEQGEGVGKA